MSFSTSCTRVSPVNIIAIIWNIYTKFCINLFFLINNNYYYDFIFIIIIYYIINDL